ncbi:MAG: helix-turn-helix domain-containing protein [Oscillospiraceae bacterium]|nr:helix-turn-helix domain-containing protein [Oscillospiraceae bacterium]
MPHYPRIRDLREDCDKKQSELAKYLGTTTQYYGLYEKGANEISFERAIALAKYYNVSLDYIAGLTNDKRGLTHSDLSLEQRELLRAAKKLRTADKEKTIAMLKAMINAIK